MPELKLYKLGDKAHGGKVIEVYLDGSLTIETVEGDEIKTRLVKPADAGEAEKGKVK